MRSFADLTAVLSEESVHVFRGDIRVSPGKPEIGPYYVVMAEYEKDLNLENQDTNRILRILRDQHRIDDFSQMETIFKDHAEDPFDPRRRSLSGKKAVWTLPDERTRFHISCDFLIKEVRDEGLEVVSMRQSLKFPKKN